MLVDVVSSSSHDTESSADSSVETYSMQDVAGTQEVHSRRSELHQSQYDGTREIQ